MPMEITSTPYDRTPRENADARPGLETRWSRPSTMLCAAGSFSSRYRPKPRPSCSANSGVSSFATSPRMSYSRKTCIGMAIARGIYARAAQATSSGRTDALNCSLASETGVAGVAVVETRARPVASNRGGSGADVGDQSEQIAAVAEVRDAVRVDRHFRPDATQGGSDWALEIPLHGRRSRARSNRLEFGILAVREVNRAIGGRHRGRKGSQVAAGVAPLLGACRLVIGVQLPGGAAAHAQSQALGDDDVCCQHRRTCERSRSPIQYVRRAETIIRARRTVPEKDCVSDDERSICPYDRRHATWCAGVDVEAVRRDGRERA